MLILDIAIKKASLGSKATFNTLKKYNILRVSNSFTSCQAPNFCGQVFGLEKLKVKAKGINHPKHIVKSICACLKRESANS